jgi:cell division protein FtsB
VKGLSVKIAFLALVLFVAVPIFRMQADIARLSKQSQELSDQIEDTADRIKYAKEKLERIEAGDEQTIRDYARDNGFYDPNEIIIYNDVYE